MNAQKSWTELPHWVVMVKDSFEAERCIAHYERKSEAISHASRARTVYSGANIRVARTT